MEQNEKIGMRIQALREEKGITQIELAKALNVKNRENIARWELGTRELKAGTIIQIAKYFNVSADYLLGMSDVKTTEQDMKIACEVTGLSEKAIENIKESMTFNLSILENAKESDVFTASKFIKTTRNKNEEYKIKDLKDFMLYTNKFKKKYVNSFIENDCFIETMALLKKGCDAFVLARTEWCKLDEMIDFKNNERSKVLENIDYFLQIDYYNSLYKTSLIDIYEKIKDFIENNAIKIEITKEDTENAEHNTPKK